VTGDSPTDPFAVLGVTESADDGAIRRAYLRLVRQHSPERDPDGFRRVRAAYEAVRSGSDRAARRLLEAPRLPDVDGVVQAMAGARIPSGSREVRAGLRAALLDRLPYLRITERDLRPIPEEPPEEVL
jgi:curved DNA-binding protein CbpA